MWGNVILESNFIRSYNFGFLSTNSDIVISLLHWQYWWWFWFSFLASFYYLIILKYISGRLLKFNPKIVNSYRSHGKWGDVIICFLPISWCVNILSNSTTLLKIIEWQSEASLLTLRVRGKQWYWLYKIDIKSILSIFESDVLTNSIGLNDVIFNSNFKNNVNNLISYKNNFINNNNIYSNYSINKNYIYKKYSLFYKFNTDYFYFINLNKNEKYSFLNINYMYDFINCSYIINNIFKLKNNVSNQLISLVNRDKILNYYLQYNFNNTNLNFLYNNISKKNNNIKYFVLLQKSISDWSKPIEDDVNFDITDNFINVSNFDNLNKINNYNNLRLLKTNNILMLPTDMFINVITNSFDVIHSWFIPGLGFKMDCIPGRSTHHTLFIDVPGIYYGQCAEICGRLHHHMPIKICAMNYEHFYLWWLHTFNNSLFVDLLIKSNERSEII